MENPNLPRSGSSFIQETLGGFYHLEKCHARDVVFLTDGGIEVFFEFKKYEKVLSPMGHVSGNLIHEAVMEGAYLAIRAGILQGNVRIRFSDDDFINSRAIAIWREVNIKFKKPVNEYERVSLVFHLKDTNNLRTQFSVATVSFRGFAEGSAKALLSLREKVVGTLT